MNEVIRHGLLKFSIDGATEYLLYEDTSPSIHANR